MGGFVSTTRRLKTHRLAIPHRQRTSRPQLLKVLVRLATPAILIELDRLEEGFVDNWVIPVPLDSVKSLGSCNVSGYVSCGGGRRNIRSNVHSMRATLLRLENTWRRLLLKQVRCTAAASTTSGSRDIWLRSTALAENDRT